MKFKIRSFARLIVCAVFIAVIPTVLQAFPFSFWKAPAGGAPTYLMQEDFTTGSGTTPPTGWTVPGGGTYSYSNTSPSLPQSGNNFSINDGAADFTWKSFTGQTECWAYFQFQVPSLAVGGAREVFALKDGSNVSQCYVRLNTDGTLQIWDAAAEATATTGTLAINTNYQIWVHYKAGSGTGLIEVKFSTTGTQPTSLGANYVQVTGTTTNATVSRVACVSNDNSVTQYFDHVLVSSTAIPDNP